jgi:threonylcarbamoyladenosine tRNA methylthiotransferase MtaB
VKVFLDTVGCRLNQSEIEKYAQQFRSAGHTLAAELAEADLVVLNTCAVTTAAEADSRQKVRQAGRDGSRQVVVTGCWSTLHPAQAGALPGVRWVIANDAKDQLAAQVLGLPLEYFDRQPLARQPIPGARMRTRAFIKAQDGCDNHCTFCLTTLARGRSRSLPEAAICQDIQAAQRGGAQEAVLTGVHLGAWGQDLTPTSRLSHLVGAVLAETDIPRLRLSSLEPWDLDEAFFALWQNRRLCRHLHLPLQSGSAATLRRMARRTTPAAYRRLAAAARQAIPGVSITTDILVGFPGESEAEFAESLDFVQEMEFAGGHVFVFSERPNTAAARLPRAVPHEVRKQRSAQMRRVLEASAARYQQHFLGQEMGVLWESALSLGPQGWQMSGLTENYLRVTATTPTELWNQITPVHLEQVQATGLVGTARSA